MELHDHLRLMRYTFGRNMTGRLTTREQLKLRELKGFEFDSSAVQSEFARNLVFLELLNPDVSSLLMTKTGM